MPRYRTAYPPEFRRQMVDLVRSGRTPEELAREFEPTAQSISRWVKQAERDVGKRTDGPTSADREEERRPCRLCRPADRDAAKSGRMIESLRVLMACRKTAVSARRVALQMIHNTVVCALRP